MRGECCFHGDFSGPRSVGRLVDGDAPWPEVAGGNPKRKAFSLRCKCFRPPRDPGSRRGRSDPEKSMKWAHASLASGFSATRSGPEKGMKWVHAYWAAGLSTTPRPRVAGWSVRSGKIHQMGPCALGVWVFDRSRGSRGGRIRVTGWSVRPGKVNQMGALTLSFSVFDHPATPGHGVVDSGSWGGRSDPEKSIKCRKYEEYRETNTIVDFRLYFTSSRSVNAINFFWCCL